MPIWPNPKDYSALSLYKISKKIPYSGFQEQGVEGFGTKMG